MRKRTKKTFSTSAYILIICMFFLLALPSCGSHRLKVSEIAAMSVKHEIKDGKEYITLSGMPFHSALSITRITLSDCGNSVNLDIDLELCRNNIGLPLYIEFEIRDKTQFVTLDNRDVIWRRK